jgi:hypothetical protein
LALPLANLGSRLRPLVKEGPNNNIGDNGIDFFFLFFFYFFFYIIIIIIIILKKKGLLKKKKKGTIIIKKIFSKKKKKYISSSFWKTLNSTYIIFKLQITRTGIKNNLEVLKIDQNNNLVSAVKFRQTRNGFY